MPPGGGIQLINNKVRATTKIYKTIIPEIGFGPETFDWHDPKLMSCMFSFRRSSAYNERNSPAIELFSSFPFLIENGR